MGLIDPTFLFNQLTSDNKFAKLLKHWKNLGSNWEYFQPRRPSIPQGLAICQIPQLDSSYAIADHPKSIQNVLKWQDDTLAESCNLAWSAKYHNWAAARWNWQEFAPRDHRIFIHNALEWQDNTLAQLTRIGTTWPQDVHPKRIRVTRWYVGRGL